MRLLALPAELYPQILGSFGTLSIISKEADLSIVFSKKLVQYAL